MSVSTSTARLAHERGRGGVNLGAKPLVFQHEPLLFLTHVSEDPVASNHFIIYDVDRYLDAAPTSDRLPISRSQSRSPIPSAPDNSTVRISSSGRITRIA
jgi:hypothetical protein